MQNNLKAKQFESHITVTDMLPEEFLAICRSLGVKPVIITNDTGSEMNQMMTAKFHKGNFAVAFEEAQAIHKHFGPNAIRLKIEQIIGKNSPLPEHKYLEFHSKYSVPTDQVARFREIVASCGSHSSQNTLKVDAGPDMVFCFATSRNRDQHIQMTKQLVDFVLVNTIMECVIYDDNPAIDKYWIGCSGCPLKTVDL